MIHIKRGADQHDGLLRLTRFFVDLGVVFHSMLMRGIAFREFLAEDVVRLMQKTVTAYEYTA